MQRVLITGISGSGGSYLADYIIEHHPYAAIYGISRWHITSTDANLRKSAHKIQMYDCDLCDLSSVFRCIKTVAPTVIFHMAAHANVRASFDNPLAVLNNNVMGTANLLEAIRMTEIDPKFILCSTSEVYGAVDPKNVPINENCPIQPTNPYGVSKLAQDSLTDVYCKCYNLRGVRTRAFGYFNPRRDDLFATSFAKQVAKIEKGLQKEVVHGNLDSIRTLIDVRDIAHAYWLSAEKCQDGEAYNIGGNHPVTVGKILEQLKTLAKCPIPSRQDPKLLRPVDVTLQIPDVSKFKKATGWEPHYTCSESLEFILDYWRSVYAA